MSAEDHAFDDAFLARLHARDETALAEVFARYEPPLLAFIAKRTGRTLKSKLEPQDIFQDVCLSAYNAAQEVDFQKTPPFRWLCQLAERRIIDAHRRLVAAQKRSAEKEIDVKARVSADGQAPSLRDFLVASVTSPSAALSRKIKYERIDAAMAELPEEAREILTLRFVDNLPTKQIAERIGKSDGAIRVAITRAVDRLQSLLEDPQESL